jgi:hypothetical protein
MGYVGYAMEIPFLIYDVDKITVQRPGRFIVKDEYPNR